MATVVCSGKFEIIISVFRNEKVLFEKNGFENFYVLPNILIFDDVLLT